MKISILKNSDSENYNLQYENNIQKERKKKKKERERERDPRYLNKSGSYLNDVLLNVTDYRTLKMNKYENVRNISVCSLFAG